MMLSYGFWPKVEDMLFVVLKVHILLTQSLNTISVVHSWKANSPILKLQEHLGCHFIILNRSTSPFCSQTHLAGQCTSWPRHIIRYIYEFPSSKSKNEVSGFNWRGHLGKAHYRTNYHQQLTIQMKPYPLNRTTTNVILNVQVKLRLLLWFGRLSKTHLHLQQEC